MRYCLGTLLFLSVTGLVLACHNDNRVPESTGPGETLRLVIDDADGCATTAANADLQAGVYFATDPGRLAQAQIKIDLIAAQCALLAQEQPAPGGQSEIDRLGFEVLKLVEESRAERAPQQLLGWDDQSSVLAAGSKLTNHILAFMNVGLGGSQTDNKFINALKTSGIYAVVLKGTTTPARTLSVATYTWGAEPDSGKSWNWVQDTRADGSSLIYGEPKVAPPQGTEAPVDRPPGTPAGEAAFTIESIPDRKFDDGNKFRVGTCNTNDAKAVLQSSDAGQFDRVLEYGNLPSFCPGQDGASNGFGSRLLRFAADFFAPPLQAATLVTTGGTSGTKSSYSEFYLVNLGTLTATATFTKKDNSVGAALPVKVELKGELGTPVEGASVTVTIQTNKGVNATFCSIPCDDGVRDDLASVEDTTNNVGVASFEGYSVKGPGGYKVTGTVAYPLAPPTFYSATFASSVFNVKQ